MSELKIERATVNVNGVDIFYRDTGGADKPVMLCLHGRWGRGETYIDFMHRYHDRYRIIAPDQRGHGLSGKPVATYRAEDMAADMYELLKYLGIDRAIIVGHSMGARIASYFASIYPQTTTALVNLDEPSEAPDHDNNFEPEQIPADDKLTSQWPLPFKSYNEAVSFLRNKFPLQTSVDYFLLSLTETVAGYTFMFSPYSMRAIEEYWVSWYDILPTIKCPVLLVRAAESWCLSKEAAEKMKPLIADLTYFEVSNSDHMVYTDNPEEFFPQFDDFLKTLAKKRQ